MGTRGVDTLWLVGTNVWAFVMAGFAKRQHGHHRNEATLLCRQGAVLSQTDLEALPERAIVALLSGTPEVGSRNSHGAAMSRIGAASIRSLGS
jgi:hypothetical protein